MSDIRVGDKFEVPKGRFLAGVWTVESDEEGICVLADASGESRTSIRTRDLLGDNVYGFKRLPSAHQEEKRVETCGHTWPMGRAPCVGPKGHLGFHCNVDGTNWEMPASPTKEEAEKPSGHIWVKSDGTFAGGAITITCRGGGGGGGRPPLTEAEIAAAMEAKNQEFHDKQAAAIKARWIEEQKQPSPYLHWGRTSAPGWAKRGVR